MYSFSEIELKNWINRTLDDSANPVIAVGTIAGAGHSDWKKIRKAIEKWSQMGYLTILKDPEFALPHEPCLHMHSFIDRKSSIPGFLND
jgi:hypothetical protein